jgi:hypothetical protein
MQQSTGKGCHQKWSKVFGLHQFLGCARRVNNNLQNLFYKMVLTLMMFVAGHGSSANVISWSASSESINWKLKLGMVLCWKLFSVSRLAIEMMAFDNHALIKSSCCLLLFCCLNLTINHEWMQFLSANVHFHLPPSERDCTSCLSRLMLASLLWLSMLLLLNRNECLSMLMLASSQWFLMLLCRTVC